MKVLLHSMSFTSFLYYSLSQLLVIGMPPHYLHHHLIRTQSIPFSFTWFRSHSAVTTSVISPGRLVRLQQMKVACRSRVNDVDLVTYLSESKYTHEYSLHEQVYIYMSTNTLQGLSVGSRNRKGSNSDPKMNQLKFVQTG